MGKRLDEFFGVGGPLYRFGSLLFDLILLDIIWLFLSGAVEFLALFYLFGHTAMANLPWYVAYGLMFLLLINWGPATVPMYYTLSKRHRGHETYVIRDYFRSYKMNFGQALLLSTGVTLIALLLVFNIMLVRNNQEVFGAMAHLLYVMQFVIALVLYLFTINAVVILARLKVTTKTLIKDAMGNTGKHLWATLLAGLVVGIGIGMLWYDQIFIFLFLPALICQIVVIIMEKFILSKYIPDEDDLVDHEDALLEDIMAAKEEEEKETKAYLKGKKHRR